jgi:hypothetical protein
VRPRSARAGLLVALVGAAVAGTAAEACRTPTEVTLDVSFEGGDCASLGAVAIVVAADPVGGERRVETNDYTTVTHGCEPGTSHVGTLVMLPTESGRGAVIVIGGLGSIRPESCKPANGYAGCIVARRTFSFSAHTALTLPVALAFSCLNVPCDAVSTCKAGGCVSSNVEASGGTFTEPGTPLPDGAIPYVDASGDATPPASDAATDASDAATDASDHGTDPCAAHDVRLRCPTDGGTDDCPSIGEVCCNYGCAPQGSASFCAPQATCMGFRFGCLGTENCGAGQICCFSASESACVTGTPAQGCSGGKQLCTSSCQCASGSCAYTTSYPYYAKQCN